MSLKVIGAGFGRTGTSSLKAALEKLGYCKCYHMTEVFKSGHAPHWLKKSRGQSIDWDELFSGYQAAVDWPVAAYYQELAEYYPDAKIILTVRDPEQWYKSMNDTILEMSRVAVSWLPSLKIIQTMVHNIVMKGEFGGRQEDATHVKAVFRQHLEEVRNSIPAERLLVFDVREGWGPLCRFLQVSIPENTAFPRLNETRDMKRAIYLMRALNAVPVIAGLAVMGMLACWVSSRI